MHYLYGSLNLWYNLFHYCRTVRNQSWLYSPSSQLYVDIANIIRLYEVILANSQTVIMR